MTDIDARITAPVQETELAERVVEAVEGLFPGADVTVEDGRVVGHADSLDRVARRLREQRILDTARSYLREHRHREGVTMELKKQAAHEGVVNFAVGSPAELGDIHVDVTVEGDVEAFIDRLAPRTDEEGRPLDADAGTDTDADDAGDGAREAGR
ncbi:MAG: coaE operon protein [Halobacteriaceae archaeon]